MMARSALKPICVVYGKNAYARRQALERIIERELTGGDPALNLRRVDGDDAVLAEVLDDVRTFSMLGDRRVVVVNEADDFISKNRAALERYVSAPADSGCLVLVCNAFDARTRLYKAVKQAGDLVECKPLQSAGVIPWLVSTARETHGKQMGRQAAAELCEHVGNSQEALDAELVKLSLYVADRAEITTDDVSAVVGRYREQNVFAVMDAIAAGDTETALREWQRVLATDRAAPARAIGGLAWGLRRLIDARRRLDQGVRLEALARENWTDVNVFRRRMQHANLRQLQDRLGDLLNADLQSKTGLGTVERTIERFIVKHCAAKAPG
jgi:DNA polymerase-3 subunit delta